MKKCIRIISTFLISIVIIAGGFLFTCRVFYHESFMAGFTNVYLKVTGARKKWLTEEGFYDFYNNIGTNLTEDVVIPKIKYNLSYKDEQFESLRAIIFNYQENPGQTVFYYHGGAYINQPNNQQWNMAMSCAYNTNATVVLMLYPKAPSFDCKTCYDVCSRYYVNYVSNHKTGKIVFMGDSAGGGIALGMNNYIIHEKLTPSLPEELILISPSSDLSGTNLDLYDEYLKDDPILGLEGISLIAQIWANDLPLDNPLVSPIYGIEEELPKVTLFTGTRELLYPDALSLKEELINKGVEVDLYVGEHLIHCYPILPTPEAKEAQSIIWNKIKR